MYSSAKTANKISPYYVEIVADYESDIATLPTHYSPGSKCFVIDKGVFYMLNNQKQWVLLPKSTGGGGSGDFDFDASLATKADIDNLFN